MNLRIQIIIAVVIILALFVIINMIRKKALELRYALTWMSGAMGIELPTNMLFFMGFCFSLTIIFGLTIAVSRMSIRIKNLTQEVALYMKREEERNKTVEK